MYPRFIHRQDGQLCAQCREDIRVFVVVVNLNPRKNNMSANTMDKQLVFWCQSTKLLLSTLTTLHITSLKGNSRAIIVCVRRSYAIHWDLRDICHTRRRRQFQRIELNYDHCHDTFSRYLADADADTVRYEEVAAWSDRLWEIHHRMRVVVVSIMHDLWRCWKTAHNTCATRVLDRMAIHIETCCVYSSLYNIVRIP